MTILMSNVYGYDAESGISHIATGFIGAFDSREKAMDVWNDTLKEKGVPESKFQEFAPSCILGNQFIQVDRNGKWTEDKGDVEFIIELMSVDTEMNKVKRMEQTMAEA